MDRWLSQRPVQVSPLFSYIWIQTPLWQEEDSLKKTTADLLVHNWWCYTRITVLSSLKYIAAPRNLNDSLLKMVKFRNFLNFSLVVRQLRLHASNAGDTGLILGGGTKIPHAKWPKNKKISMPEVTVIQLSTYTKCILYLVIYIYTYNWIVQVKQVNCMVCKL